MKQGRKTFGLPALFSFLLCRLSGYSNLSLKIPAQRGHAPVERSRLSRYQPALAPNSPLTGPAEAAKILALCDAIVSLPIGYWVGRARLVRSAVSRSRGVILRLKLPQTSCMCYFTVKTLAFFTRGRKSPQSALGTACIRIGDTHRTVSGTRILMISRNLMRQFTPLEKRLPEGIDVGIRRWR